MEYKISKVGFFSVETYGKDNNHRVMVGFEGQEKEYSAFVQEKPNVGDVWTGELKRVEKNDKIYNNFEFEKKSSTFSRTPGAPDLNRVEVKIDAVRTDIQILRGDLADMKGVLGSILQKLGGQIEDSPF